MNGSGIKLKNIAIRKYLKGRYVQLLTYYIQRLKHTDVQKEVKYTHSRMGSKLFFAFNLVIFKLKSGYPPYHLTFKNYKERIHCPSVSQKNKILLFIDINSHTDQAAVFHLVVRLSEHITSRVIS